MEEAREILEVHTRIDQIRIGSCLADEDLHLVVLVPDLADQLFENVLHRHNAARSAVLVDHDGDMRLLLLDLLEKPADRLVFQHENRRHENVADGLFRDAAADVKIFL